MIKPVRVLIPAFALLTAPLAGSMVVESPPLKTLDKNSTLVKNPRVDVYAITILRTDNVNKTRLSPPVSRVRIDEVYRGKLKVGEIDAVWGYPLDPALIARDRET